jgi:hypothetical protein
VSPLAAKSWQGSCPVYICTGTELLTDEDKHLASFLAAASVPVVFEEFQALPHCFAILFGDTAPAKRYFTGVSVFMGAVTQGDGKEVVAKRTLIRLVFFSYSILHISKVFGAGSTVSASVLVRRQLANDSQFPLLLAYFIL